MVCTKTHVKQGGSGEEIGGKGVGHPSSRQFQYSAQHMKKICADTNAHTQTRTHTNVQTRTDAHFTCTYTCARQILIRNFYTHIAHMNVTCNWAMSHAKTSCHIRLRHMCTCAYENREWESVTCARVTQSYVTWRIRMWHGSIRRDIHIHSQMRMRIWHMRTYDSVVCDMTYSQVTWLNGM